jgi:AcrR family transcriptional regulator
MLELQRARLLDGAVAAVSELGWSGVTVADIAAHARVSRKTFYDLFCEREDCLLAVLDDTLARVEDELAGADLEGVSWCGRVRRGLWIVLSFFDREPELARLLVVGSAGGGYRVQEWRQGVIARLAAIIDEGRPSGARGQRVPVLTAEGMVGAVLMVLHTRLLPDTERASLSALQGQLMGMIVLPYLGVGAAFAECERPTPQTPVLSSAVRVGAYRADVDPFRDIPMRLTYRTARVLEAAAEHPGSSNRFIGEQADVHDQGQISKLLARLERIGLLQNTSEGHTKGEPNAWSLTTLGERVTEHLALRTSTRHGASQRSASSSGGVVQTTVPERRQLSGWRPGTARNERKSSK